MEREPAKVIRRYLRTMIVPAGAGDQTDRQLLEQFATQRDETAFATLVHRHGPLVWGVCRRLLHHHDAEDAFQATFLVLARKAGTIRRPELLANWLYGVACRTAARARADTSRRRAQERAAAMPAVVLPSTDVLWQDVRPILDEEIQRLPAKYRTPFILCYLEGRTNEEAARQLGCPKGTILSRLAWARQRLRGRLERRGVSLAVGGMAALLEQRAARAAVSARLVETTVDGILAHSAGKFVAGGVIAAGPAVLAQGVLHQMFLTQLKMTAAVMLLIGSVGLGAWTYAGRGGASASTPATPTAQGESPSPRREADPDVQLARRQLEAAIQDLIQVQADLRKVKVDITFAQADVNRVAQRPISDDDIDRWMAQDPEVEKYAQEIQTRQARLDELERVLGGGKENRFYQQELSKLNELKKELARRRRRVRPLAEDELRARMIVQPRNKLATLQSRLAYLQEMEKVLDADIRRLSLKTRSQEASTDERLRSLEKDIKQIKAAVEELKKK
jgi:RNA polymerase sigma factor (sigma-70 family)